MGTRSLTRVFDGKRQLVNIYQQFDGYPSGVGKVLANFLTGLTVVNGISDRTVRIANGAGCLAAQLIAEIKTEAGGVYIYPTRSTDCGQDYEYHIVVDEDDSITVKCKSYSKSLFNGTVDDFVTFCASGDD